MSMVYAETIMQALTKQMQELEQDYARLRTKLAQAEEMFLVIQAVQGGQAPGRDAAEDRREDAGRAATQ